MAPSESSVGPALLEQFGRCKGRIIVTSFASNIHRVQQVIDAAERLDRKVALVGRSMRKNYNIASNLGIAKAPQGIFIQPKEIENFPDEKVVVISTGSQGEPLSALRRMANNDHRDVQLHSGDTVVFSATPVPGNERAVNETIDRIYEIGATVITAKDAPIHASGHGWQEELKLMLNLTKPKYVLPVHGDHKRLRLHAELAEAVGIESERIFQGRNGVPLEVDRNGAGFGEDIHAGVIYVDGVNIGEPDDAALRDRREISADGIFIVVSHDLQRRRHRRRRPRGDLPRRRLPRGGRRAGRGPQGPGRRPARRLGRERQPRAAADRGRPARRRSASSSGNACAAGRWSCRW